MKRNDKPQRKTNLMLIFRMMLKYWYHGLMGLITMLLFAIFSGVSITLVIPLFDYVFKAEKPLIHYHNYSSFLAEGWYRFTSFLSAHGGVWHIKSLDSLKPLGDSMKDLMLHTDSLALLYSICIFVVVVIFLKNVFFYANKMFFVVLRGRTIRDVRDYMFRRYLSQGMEFYNQNQVGDAIVRMVNDVDNVSNQFIYSIFNSIRDFTTILTYMFIAIALNPRLFLYSIIVLPIFSFSISFMGKKIKKYSKRIQAQLSTMFSTVEEVLNSMKIVKAFRKEDKEFEAFSLINRRHLKLWQRAMAYSALNVPLSEINSTLTGVLVIILGGKLILNPAGGFSLGNFTAFLFALFSMLHPLKTITQMYAEIKKAVVSLDRIAIVLNKQSSIQDSPNAIAKKTFDQSIVLDHVSFYYKEDRNVINDISLTIKKGQKVAFVGSSGGGKTTIANLLNRMYDVTGGMITMDGIDIREIKLKDLRSLFGIVTQDSVLFTKSIRENIAYGGDDTVSDSDIREAARIAHADEFIVEFPDRYDQILDTKGANLSGGQRQRLCIARAIVANPPILIFDEATSALDTDSERKVQDAIDDATRNRTVVIIAHRLSTILKSDLIVVLEAGKIVGMGSHEELLKTCPRYQHLHGMQYNS
ncbi:MAG TPA: ABC transporter ATP-binding protein [Candidatus Cloacimonadota bacterium]|nr:ABC transporter ATP-binding protein [Candidatus Cloacimonadota bacterium]HPS38928.1 ABC transporter ATP-binding protein [Candidatus Cloacimonadota bacterium]